MSRDWNRRRFLQTSVVAAALAATWACSKPGAVAGGREYYELRTYRVQTAEKQEALLAYVESALLPALNRMGLERIGVFTSLDKADDHDVRVLIPFPTLDAFSRAERETLVGSMMPRSTRSAKSLRTAS